MSYFFLDGGGGWRYVIPHISKTDTVIGSNSSINNFFQEFMNVPIIKLQTPPTLFGNNKNPLYNAFQANREYDRYFKQLKNEDIYLFGRVATVVFFSYLNKLSKNNRIHFLVPHDKEGTEWFFNHKPYHSMYTPPLKLIARLLGINIGVMRTLGRPMWYLKKQTVSSYDFVQYKREEPRISIPDKYKKLMKQKTTLLLLGDLKTLTNDYEAVSNMTASLLDPKKTIIKNHTRDPPLFGPLKTFDMLPSYVPSELLIHSFDWEYIVSINLSKTLQLETDATKVSLYNLVDWNFPFTKERITTFTDKNVILPTKKEEVLDVIH
jgi:hypothetical protein